jgi:hypothetical protein
MEVHVQVERATEALDDGHRSRTPIAVPRCLSAFPVEAEQRTRVNREHGAAKLVVPCKLIAKLEGKAQYPLANRCAWEHVVDEMRSTLGHPAASAAGAKAPTFAGKRD